MSIIPCIEHGLAPYDGKIEINVIAAKPRQRCRASGISMPALSTAFRHQPQAVKAGDLLFIPALMAADREGLLPAAAVDPRQPYFSSSPEAQAEAIIDNIARLCAAAGTSLANVVRVLLFLTDIARLLSGLQSLGAPARRAAAAVFRGRSAGAAAGAGSDGDDGSVGLCAISDRRHRLRATRAGGSHCELSGARRTRRPTH